jgi:hypothetical protein
VRVSVLAGPVQGEEAVVDWKGMDTTPPQGSLTRGLKRSYAWSTRLCLSLSVPLLLTAVSAGR